MAEVSKTRNKLNLIVAYDNSYGIGNEGKIPWPRLATDMKHLHERTTSTTDPGKQNVIITGRKTFESIPVRARKKIFGKCFKVVLSRGAPIDGADLTSDSLENAMTILHTHPDKDQFESFWVLGGRIAYSQALSSAYALKLYATLLNESFQCDTFFPILNWSEWKEVHEPEVATETIIEEGISYQFKIYIRNTIE